MMWYDKNEVDFKQDVKQFKPDFQEFSHLSFCTRKLFWLYIYIKKKIIYLFYFIVDSEKRFERSVKTP